MADKEPEVEETVEPPAPAPAPDPALPDLVVQLESMKLRVSALEDALCNLQGFSKATEGSQQGRVTFSRNLQVAPVFKEA